MLSRASTDPAPPPADEQRMHGSISETLDNIEQRWRGADTRALRSMFPLLARGRALTLADIAAHLGIGRQRVDAALQYPTVGTDDSGSLVELFGFMLRPSWHRVDIEGRAMFTCCALVAHAVPALTGRPVRIVSVDPDGRGVVEIEANRDGVTSVHPSEACATLPVSDGPWPGQDVAAHFCSHIRHFPSRQRAQEFASGDSRRRVLELDAFHGHAVEISERIFGAAVS